MTSDTMTPDEMLARLVGFDSVVWRHNGPIVGFVRVCLADHVYEVIAGGAGAKAVGHGFAYSGHPVSAAVALEVLSLYEGGLLENGRKMGARLQDGLRSLSDHPLVSDVRGRGMLAAVELAARRIDGDTGIPADVRAALAAVATGRLAGMGRRVRNPPPLGTGPAHPDGTHPHSGPAPLCARCVANAGTGPCVATRLERCQGAGNLGRLY